MPVINPSGPAALAPALSLRYDAAIYHWESFPIVKGSYRFDIDVA